MDTGFRADSLQQQAPLIVYRFADFEFSPDSRIAGLRQMLS